MPEATGINSMKELIALGAILVWPVIPLFWIPIHLFAGLFRKIGFATYIFPALLWFPVVYLLLSLREPLLSYRVSIPLVVELFGWILFMSGLLGQALTVLYLKFAIIGVPEVSDKIKIRVVRKGPFALSRHPTYVAHTMIFAGVFMLTGVLFVALITLTDLFFSLFIIIPLEERELLRRFGEEYREYMNKVPRFLPKVRFRSP